MKKFFRRLAACTITLCILFGLLPGTAVFAAGSEDLSGIFYSPDDFINNEVLILYQDGRCEVYSYETQEELIQALPELASDETVSVIQPNFVYTQSQLSVNDEYGSQQWALSNNGTLRLRETYSSGSSGQSIWNFPWGNRFSSSPETTVTISSVAGIDINVEEAWSLYNGGVRDTVIALIDTGVDTSHEDFGDIFWVNEGEIPGNGIDDDGNGYVDDINGWNFYGDSNQIYVGEEDAHGTHGAGSIAATKDNGTGMAGIVPDCTVQIMVLKILGGDSGTGTTLDLIRAIQYAENNGAVICNLSFGTPTYDPALYQVMSQSEMLFVASAGNDGENLEQSPVYPASFHLDNVVAVGNLQPDGTLHGSSNYSAQSVDIAVPGTYILSTQPDNGYSYSTGTSMSAPIFSAVAAMLYSSCENLTILQIKDIILSSARPLDSLQGLVSTGGMLDAGAAMALLSEYGTVLPFADVSADADYLDAVVFLYENGIMIGTSDTAFSPGLTLTRAMVITMLARIDGAEEQPCTLFSDVPENAWYSGYVGWASENGIVIGYGNGKFGPEDPVTAEQLDLILSRYAGTLGLSYQTDLMGNQPLTRAETAQAFYEFCLALELL